MAEFGKYAATAKHYIIKNGEKILKVAEPYYCHEKKVIRAYCPHCGTEVNRLWEIDYCGDCGGRISWHDLRVEGYGDIE